MRVYGWKDMQSAKSASSMLYLELKTSILPPLEANDKRHKLNSNNNRLKRTIYQFHFKNVWAVVLHSFKVCWISLSVCLTSVWCVQLCNYSDNFCQMQSFFQKKYLLWFICSIEQLGFLLIKIEMKEINKKFS